MFHLSDYLIFASSFASLLFSIFLWFTGHIEEGPFVDVWVPSILIFGMYTRGLKQSKNLRNVSRLL